MTCPQKPGKKPFALWWFGLAIGLPCTLAQAVVPQAPSDATAEIQRLLDQQKEVVLPVGTFLISRSIDIPDHARLQGAGKGRTVLKLKQGANTDLVRTEGFGQLAGRQALMAAPSRFELSDLTLDGGYLEKPWNSAENAVLNEKGSCLKAYGRRFVIDVEVTNCAENGIYVEGQGPRDGAEVASTIRVEGQLFGKEALIFRGPGDILIEYAVLGIAGFVPTTDRAETALASTVYGSYKKIDGVVVDKMPPYEGTVEIDFMHIYGAGAGVGFRTLGNPRVQIRHLISEGNLGGIAISAGTWGGIGLLDIHSNGRAWQGAGRPMEGALIESTGPFTIGSGVLSRTVGSGEDWLAVRSTGTNQMLNLVLRGNINPQTKELYRGDGVVVEGSGNVVQVALRRVNGSPLVVGGSSNRVSGVVTETSGRCTVIGNSNDVSVTSDSANCSLPERSSGGLPADS
jgi:hypothetical protein